MGEQVPISISKNREDSLRSLVEKFLHVGAHIKVVLTYLLMIDNDHNNC